MLRSSAASNLHSPIEIGSVIRQRLLRFQIVSSRGWMFRRTLFSALVACGLSVAVQATPLPGFKLQKVITAPAGAFITSLTIDSHGTIYYSSRGGEIYRFDGTNSVLVTKLDTATTGNEGLLGIALRSDHELLAHHVLVDESGDIISSVALPSGETKTVATFICDGGRVCGNEHHGGNITVASDGSAYFAIGDYGGNIPAQQEQSPGGKVFQILPDNTVTRWALGFRNPYDMAYDDAAQALIIGDNGPVAGDEINVVRYGENGGWPFTFGNQPAVAGMLPPSYVFQLVTAPTGLQLLNGRGFLRRGVLVGGFVTKGLHYLPQTSGPMQSFDLFTSDIGPVLDVTQASDGTIWVAGFSAIYRLITPHVGDCDGDGFVDAKDSNALAQEILDGDGTLTWNAQFGGYRGSWGCDVNQDGLIDARDLVALTKLREGRHRPVNP